MKKFILLIVILFSFSGYSQLALEGFESTTGPDALPSTNWTLGTGNWAVFDNGVGLAQRWGINSGVSTPPLVYAGTNAAFVNRENAGINTTRQDWMATPAFTVPTNAQLKFWTRTRVAGDQGTVYYAKIKPVSASLQDNTNDYVVINATGATWSENTLNAVYNEYEEKVVDIPASYVGQQVYIAFEMEFTQPTTSIGGDSWLIDNVKVSSLCVAPTLPTASPILATSASLSWGNPGNAAAFEIENMLATATPTGMATTTGILANTYLQTSLTPLTDYKYYVRAVCGTDFSAWVGPFTYTTLDAGPQCGGNYVDSGGTTANYANSENITTVICPLNTGDQVTVTFTTFDIETNWDGLYVFDGASVSSPQIPSTNGPGTSSILSVPGAYWGTTNPGPFTSSSPDGCLTFNFKSDGSVAHAGWTANITCAQPPLCPKPTALSTTAVLATTATLAWTNVGPATAWQVIALPCGSPAPDATTTGWIDAPTNPFTIPNTSPLTPATCYDFYVRGVCSPTEFSAVAGPKTATTPVLPPLCGGNFVDSGGVSASYQNNEDITTTICPTDPNTQAVTVVFTSFDTEVKYDGMYVYDGNSITSPLIPSTNGAGTSTALSVPGAYWGTTIPGPFTSSSPDGCLTFRFRSDSVVTKTGWLANIICDPKPNCTKPTNVTVTNITQNSALISWTETGSSSNWQILVLPASAPAPTATSINWTDVSTNPYTYTGFGQGSNKVYIRSKCSNTIGDNSNWSSPVTFSTPPPSCITNDPAGNSCSVSVPICNLNGYCGNTSSAYVPPHTWTELTSAFCGSIDNNSFLSFVATGTTVSLNVWVTTSTSNLGIQFMVFSAATCGSGPVTNFGCLSPIAPSLTGPTTFTATGLTPGQTYYLMIDGYAGDVCDYVIAAGQGVQLPVDITPVTSTTTPTICTGQTATLNANGGTGQYTWETLNGGTLNTTTGNTVVFTPPGIGSFDIKATTTGGNLNCPASKTQTITVVDYVTTTFTQIPAFCQGTTAPLLPTSSTNNPPITGTWSPSVINNTTVGTTTYTFTPNVTFCATPYNMQVTVSQPVTPTFFQPPPICLGASAPILNPNSNNNPPISGTWLPPIVSNTASGNYVFTPNSGQCATTTNLSVIVNQTCAFGSQANAAWLSNCSQSNFFNTVGSGASIIGPVANVFVTNQGTYTQNSGNFLLKGAELKTYKSSVANVCSAKLKYRVYLQSATPPAFSVMDLPFFSNCGTNGQYTIGAGPCNTGDQKWQKVLPNTLYPTESPIDLTAYPPGKYFLETYYEITGSADTTNGCGDTILINNNGANFIADYSIQSALSSIVSNPTTCGGTQGTITISGLAANTSYSLTYNFGTTAVGPLAITSAITGEIIISGLTAGTYSNINLTANGCSFPITAPVILQDPNLPVVNVNPVIKCDLQTDAITATPVIPGNYTYNWTVPTGETPPGNVPSFNPTVSGPHSVIITDTTTNCSSISSSGNVTINPNITPTFSPIAPFCAGIVAPILQNISNAPESISGTWMPATIDNTTSGTYVFTASSGTCITPVSLSVNVYQGVPTPTLNITQPTCTTPATVVVQGPLNNSGNIVSNLFISEVTDAQTGQLTYVELYNGTGAPVDLSNYKLKFYTFGNNPTPGSPANLSCNLSLSGTVANNATNLIKVSNAANIVGVTPNQTFTTCGGVNNNDSIRLTTSSDVEIDSWGAIDGSIFTPLGQPGYTYRRHANATIPSLTWNPADWDAVDPEDYSNLGIYPIIGDSYVYSLDGGPTQTGTTFTPVAVGNNHYITATNTVTGCSSQIQFNIIAPVPVNPVTDFAYPTPICQAAPINPLPNTNIMPGFTPNGTYSATPAGLVIDPNTGLINLSTSTSGTYTIKYEILPVGCLLTGSSTFQIVIDQQITPTFNPIGSICEGSTLAALPTTSTNGVSGSWSPALNNTTTTTYTFTPNPLNLVGNNLIVNGDFSAGNTGFTSDYSYITNAGTNGQQKAYGIVSSANTWFQFFPACIGSGDYLIADGSVTNGGNDKVWEQTVTVLPNHDYIFKYKLQTIAMPNQANIEIKVNGVSIGTDIAPSTNCDFATFSHVWHSGPNNTADIAMFDKITIANGNDFAIDDISFTEAVPQCATTAAMTITVNPKVTPTFTQVAAICSGASLSALPTLSTNTSNQISGNWSPALNNLATTTYTFTPTPTECATTSSMTIVVNTTTAPTAVAQNLCTGSKVSDLVATGTAIQWYDVATGGAPLAGNTLLVSGNYYATQTLNSCESNRTNVTVNINSLTTPTFTQIPTICSGSSSTSLLQNSSTNTPIAITGTWSPAWNDTVTTLYTFTPVVGQCASTATMLITVNPIITPTFTQVPSICTGDNLSALPTSSTNTPNAITGTWVPATMNNTLTTTYSFAPTAGQCATTVTMTIVVNPVVTPDFNILSTYCSVKPVLSLLLTSPNGVTGTWNPSAIDNISNGTYVFTASIGQCANTQTVNITINKTPDFQIQAGCQESQFVLEAFPLNNSYTSSSVIHSWEDSSSVILGTTQSIIISQPGTYFCNITSNGCSAKLPVTVAQTACLIQKGISPNGDGANEVFDLSARNVSMLSIYNRYGRKVYSKSNYVKEWGGQSDSGDVLPDGTYYYIIEQENGETLSGWILINK